MHQLPDDTFVEKLREYNGTPRDVLENRELMALLLPILRADFEACETYRCDEQSPLDMPLTLFGGEDDVDTPPHYFDAWRRHTKGPLTMFWFRGDHFFLHTASDRFLSTVVQVLNSIASSTSHERHW